MARQPGLFDVDERLRRLSDIGDQLEAFTAVVDFEMFRSELVAALNYSDGAKGGRPPFDPVLMFKILVIQAQTNLSDDRAEFLVNDRLSFMRFLGLGLGDKVPDAKTIWAFRERLTRAGAIEALFARFDRAIREAGYIPMSGQIVDASLVSAPKQRNSDGEKSAIKEGRVPEEWTAKPAKLRQKDRDARWTLVFGKDAPPISPIALEAVTRIDAIFDLERAINGTDAEGRRGVGQRDAAPLVADLEQWMRTERAALSRHAPVAKAMDYMLRRWDGFARFPDDGSVCLSNNAAERALRGIALGRKAWLFAGSERGGDRAAFMYSLIVTAKLNAIDPQAWLADVLGRIAEMPASRLGDLLPWNWRPVAAKLAA